MLKTDLKWWIPAAVLIVVAGAFVRDPYIASLIKWIAIAAVIAASLRFVLLIGELNFATAAFVGLGAYTAGVCVTMFGLPFLIAILAGGIVAMLISIVFGYVTLRTKGPYFLLIGFAFTEVVRIIYSKSLILGGNSGMIGIFPPRFMDDWMTAFVLFVALVLLMTLYAIEKSDFGKVLSALRDNENVALSVGLNTLWIKVICFAIASFAAGIAGTLHAFVNNVISPGDFSFLLSTFALAYVKVGGESSIFGSIAGAILLVLLGSYAVGLGAGEHIFYGAAILLAVLLMPQGLVGLAGNAVGRVYRRRA